MGSLLGKCETMRKLNRENCLLILFKKAFLTKQQKNDASLQIIYIIVIKNNYFITKNCGVVSNLNLLRGKM